MRGDERRSLARDTIKTGRRDKGYLPFLILLDERRKATIPSRNYCNIYIYTYICAR